MPENSELNKLLSLDTSKLSNPLTDIQAQIALREAYDADYGLNTGLYGIGICDEELLLKGSLKEHWAREYKKCRIWDTFHMDYTTFMGLCRAEMQMLCRLAIEEDLKIPE